MKKIKQTYLNILEEMSDCAAVLSVDYLINYSNPALCELLNLNLIEINGKNLFEIFPENISNQIYQLMNSTNPNKFESEIYFVDTTGLSYFLKLKLIKIFEKDLISFFILLIVNTNKYTSAIELLEKEKFFLTQAQNVAKIGIWETDLCDLSTKWSDETFDLFEIDSSEFKPCHSGFIELVHPDDRIKVNSAFMASLTQKTENILEHRLLLKNGKVKFIEERWKIIFNQNEVPVRVLGTCQNISERKISEEKIQHYAFYDSLTNLPNRLQLLDRLQNMHSSSISRSNCDAVIFIDLDNFKNLNDTHGHDVGDLLLIETAKRLNFCIKKSDAVGRLGGDEFIVIMQDLSDELDKAAFEAETLAKDILINISEPYDLNGHQHLGTASIGISLFCNQEISVTGLLKRADTAMYQAKNAGGNTYRFYDPEMQSALQAKKLLDSDLLKAVNEHQFKLFYQMQVDKFNNIQSAEALIRWPHPKLGLISPKQFIPAAEETSIIVSIGEWVLNSACLQLKKWEKTPNTENFKISVNVSARQFHQPDFVKQVINTIESHKINSAKLKFELTETIVLDNSADTISKMQDLKKFGILFSLDDFGTGYSSLSYLTKLPLDELKIDQTFVHNIFENEKDKIIVQTILGMAQNLGIKVIAEGVETEIQKSFLEFHGCSLFQGFLYGKPVPVDVFEEIVRTH